MERFTRVRNEIKLLNRRYAIAAAIALTGVLAKDIPGSRDRLPEPFDVMNHTGNVNISFYAGAIAGLFVGARSATAANKNNEYINESRTRIKMGAAGFAAALLLNSLTETKIGVSIVPGPYGESTPDAIDLIYGTIAGGMCGAMIPTFESEEGPTYEHFEQEW